MAKPSWRPRLSRDFSAAARGYALDVAGSVVLFLAASLAAGRVWRFPFDDEIYTLNLIGRLSPLELAAVFPAQADVHPPLSYLVFSALQHAGADVPAMRLASLAMTALALALFHLLALTLMARRKRDMAPASRLIAVVLFGLCPLAVSQGDALRWYPLFAALIALFVTLYIFAGNNATRLWAAAALGLAGSTNVLAAPVALAFALYRYGLQRQFRERFDAGFWLVAALFGSLGVYTAASLLTARTFMFAGQLGNGIVRAAATDALGFFGGEALGVSQAWLVLSALAVTVIAAATAIARKRPDAPTHLLLLMLATAALTILAGFAKPRSFLYLAPVVALLVTLLHDRWVRAGRTIGALAVAVLLTAANVAAIAQISRGTHPFKRNTVIPYQSIVDFIGRNGSGHVLVLSSDPVVPWVLNKEGGGKRCAGYLLQARTCLGAGQHYDSVFVIRGHSDKSANAAFMARVNALFDEATAGRCKVATIHAGLDRDAAIKSRLTGVPLDETILTVDLYR